jgi:hypothetical protein
MRVNAAPLPSVGCFDLNSLTCQSNFRLQPTHFVSVFVFLHAEMDLTPQVTKYVLSVGR